MRDTIPTKKIKPKTKIPYLTGDLLHLVRKKYRLYNHAKRVGTARAWFKYTKVRNHVTSALRSAKKVYFHQLADNTHEPRDFWSQYHKLNPKHSRTPANLLHHGVKANSPTEKANLFNNFLPLALPSLNLHPAPLPPLAPPAQSYQVSPAPIVKSSSCSPHTKPTQPLGLMESPV